MRPIAPLYSTLIDLERPNSRSPTFRSLIFHKGAHVGHMLLFNLYMWSRMATSHLTLGDFERSKSRSLPYCVKIKYCVVKDQIHIFDGNINLDII